MDLKSFAETYWSMQEGKVNPGLQAYLDKKKGKKENGDDDEKENGNGKESKGSKPDFLDLDKDGDKKEPMKKAAKEKKEETEHNYVNTYLDELKKTTMGSYIKKASVDAANRSFDQGDSEKRKYDPDEADEKEEKKIANRVKGIARAAKKLTKEHHQKDADGNTVPHEDEAAGTPSSVNEKTVLEQLSEDGREIDAFEAVISYLIDEGLTESWEEAEKIMITLKGELVEEVYRNQLWTLFDGSIEENRQVAMNPEKYKDPDESDKPYSQRSRAARMRDPKRGINSPAFKKFMADRGM